MKKKKERESLSLSTLALDSLPLRLATPFRLALAVPLLAPRLELLQGEEHFSDRRRAKEGAGAERERRNQERGREEEEREKYQERERERSKYLPVSK